MLEGGEDVRFLARRLVILASEDVGNADPAGVAAGRWLPRTPANWSACPSASSLGSGVIYLACAPKSNAATVRHWRARADVCEAACCRARSSARCALWRVQAAWARRRIPYATIIRGHCLADYLGIEREYYRPTDRGFERELAEAVAMIRARLRGKR